eukprot:4829028-Amphidinium_carterae.1
MEDQRQEGDDSDATAASGPIAMGDHGHPQHSHWAASLSQILEDEERLHDRAHDSLSSTLHGG